MQSSIPHKDLLPNNNRATMFNDIQKEIEDLKNFDEIFMDS